MIGYQYYHYNLQYVYLCILCIFFFKYINAFRAAFLRQYRAATNVQGGLKINLKRIKINIICLDNETVYRDFFLVMSSSTIYYWVEDSLASLGTNFTCLLDSHRPPWRYYILYINQYETSFIISSIIPKDAHI